MEGQGGGLSRSDARTISRALKEGWTDTLQDEWVIGASELLASENLRNKAAGLELIKSMRAVDAKLKEVEIKERELALKERLADNAERRKLTRELAAGNPAALVAAIARLNAANGREGQPVGVDGCQAGQSEGHQDTGTEGLEREAKDA